MSKKKSAEKRQTDGRWPLGSSGNAAGRPIGSRNKSTLYLEELMSSDGEALVQKAKELALEGDTTALRLCLERICPPRKERTINLELPVVRDGQGHSAVVSAILRAVGDGHITPGEGESLVRMVETGV